MLKRAVASIRKAVDYQGGDFFTVSIFKKEDRGEGERMYRIAAEWTDPERASTGGRSWAFGKGFTGVAWQLACTNRKGDVVEADCSGAEIADKYPVDDPNPEREALYRSVAAIPIFVGATNEVWGVVTATTDRIGVFKRDRSNLQVQNVDTIRDVARLAALLAGLEEASARGPFIGATTPASVQQADSAGGLVKQGLEWLSKHSPFGRNDDA
jgi:hypothetical protein